MGGLLKLISKIYGKNALSKTIGTRTNVVTLPNNKIKKYIKRELDIESVPLETAQAAKKEMEQLIAEVPKMNDAERLIFEGNLRRLDNKLNPPSAEITDIQTRQKVSKEGIRSLEDQLGLPSDVDVDSPLGRVMMKTKQIQKEGKDLAKEFGMEDQLKKGLDDLAQSQIQMSKMQDEGLVRATAREIMDRDIKSGKLKIPKQEMDVITEYSSVNDPLDVWRKYYGEDALEQLDSMVPDFYQMRTSTEAADAATKKFTFTPKTERPKESFTPEEIQKVLKDAEVDPETGMLTPKKPDPEDPELFADGGRVGMAAGGMIKLINKLIKSKKMGAERGAEIIDLMEQAKKAGIPIETMNDLKNFENQIQEVSGKLYESRKKFPGVEGEKSGLPVNRPKRASGGLAYMLGE